MIVLSFAFGGLLLLYLVTFLRYHELPSRLMRWGLFSCVVALLSRGVWYSILQYQIWKKSLPTLLPPYQPFYFFQYAFFHFFSGFFLSAVIGILLLVVFWILQRRSHGKWLDTNERFLVFIGALAAGWPGAILYAVGVFVLPLLATPWLARNVYERRVRIAPFIILSALLAMIGTPFIVPYAPWLQVLVCKTCL